jgi:hypothetical protein
MAVDTGDGVGSLCYLAWKQTSYAVFQVYRATALTPAINGVGQGLTTASTNHGTYTCAATSALATGGGNFWVVTLAGFNNAANNGTFIMGNTTNGASATFTAYQGSANFVVETNTAGATMTISGNSTTYRIRTLSSSGPISVPNLATTGYLNQWGVGSHSFIITNCTNAGNNGTFTIVVSNVGETASGSGVDVAIGVTNSSGVNEVTPSSAAATENTKPSSDLYSNAAQFNHWIPYYYEVWQTNDGNSPVYFRFVYFSVTAQASTAPSTPVFNLSICTNLTSSNFVSGNFVAWGTTPTTELKVISSGTARGANTYEFDIAGNGNTNGDCWFAMCLWRNAPDTSASFLLTFDRTRTSSGGQTDTYAYLLMAQPTLGAQCIFKPGAGSVTANQTNSWPAICIRVNTELYDGMTPALPVFPLVGFVGNPTLSAMLFAAADITDGMQTMVSVGSQGTHNYLISKNNNNTGVSNVTDTAIRWE